MNWGNSQHFVFSTLCKKRSRLLGQLTGFDPFDWYDAGAPHKKAIGPHRNACSVYFSNMYFSKVYFSTVYFLNPHKRAIGPDRNAGSASSRPEIYSKKCRRRTTTKFWRQIQNFNTLQRDATKCAIHTQNEILYDSSRMHLNWILFVIEINSIE